ncbi:MAG: MBL fold metallo-hydrolase [Clostridium butyricum]|nr:MBL fold metallo-hydrolase [Clostridium butyricum]
MNIKNFLKRNSYLFPLIIIILLIILIFCNLNCNPNDSFINSNDKMIIHYIDVNQGDATLIQVNTKNILIDSGPESSKKNLLAYLNSINLDKLDYVVATHPHEDHIGNMQHIIKEYDILSFYAPKITSNTKTFEEMIDSIKSKNLKINIIKEGTSSIDLGPNTSITVFSPSKYEYDNLNNYSPIIKIEYKNTSFLFTGDAEEEVENTVLQNNFPISSDVLKVGHHGSSTSTSTSFLSAVNPSISIISVGEDNNYNHPSNETIKKLQQNKSIIYRTDIDGNIVLISNGNTIFKK